MCVRDESFINIVLTPAFSSFSKVKRLAGSKTKKAEVYAICTIHFKQAVPRKRHADIMQILHDSLWTVFLLAHRSKFSPNSTKVAGLGGGNIFLCMKRGFCSGCNNTDPRRALFTSTFLFVLHIRQGRPSSVGLTKVAFCSKLCYFSDPLQHKN